MNGTRMIPRGNGFEVDGFFFATWSAAYAYLHDGEIPTSEQVEQFEDQKLERMIEAETDRKRHK